MHAQPQSTLGLELVGQERVPNGFKDLWDRKNPKKTLKNLVMSLAYQGAVHGLAGYCRLKTTP